MNSKVLIIEDDLDIQELIKIALTSKEIGEVHTADDISSGKEMLETYYYDVILLDINLKSESGYELIKYIKSTETKIIVVSAKDTELDVYKGFEHGAIDYVKKPFDPLELSYRVKAHIKKKTLHRNQHLTVNLDTTEVYNNEEKVYLTYREYELLHYFIVNQNQILSKEQLYEHVWGYHTALDDNTLMVHIRTLRKKVEQNPRTPELIQTVRGKGYIYRSLS
ncbi:response regulator transcription factor [Staphylococcus massiliensis]|uniref:DNA-binding response regulator n=1 Tax=Staphylococcus massiliensis S46 TaxID=1229783 RepID=K9ARG6_9STAP|nr:response regulator transcription factor [Staphylococcus massiliensis]EKU50028.1 hypothetical protein C273_02128 [Staphylococcus massiliensis S46]MCG3399212.1 response regulator transcription factor [Staphylococcus massiliensis]MCG3402265.1 response regulator transcription factor [Staphylococcus massiliensis]MCG3413406.1 response regulator transcription factor [Staphylococcus massiliensis]POA00290.1 DNA-binding response regulator [Staphylococcus massiliensis CCUG 55927]